MAFTSLGVVLVSTLTFVLGTFPEFQSFEESGTPEEYPQAVFAMEMVDNVLVGFFVIEYVVSTIKVPKAQLMKASSDSIYVCTAKIRLLYWPHEPGGLVRYHPLLPRPHHRWSSGEP